MSLLSHDPRTPLLKDDNEDEPSSVGGSTLADDEWGSVEARQEMERNLVWKLDKRMSILILIYILNYVRVHLARNSSVSAHFSESP